MGSHPSIEVPLHTTTLDFRGVGPMVDPVTVLPPLNQIPPSELLRLDAPGDSHSNVANVFLAEQEDGIVNSCALATVTVTVTESEPANAASQPALPAHINTTMTHLSATAEPQRRVDEPPRSTYDPITYYEVAYATFTLILDATTLIPHADGSTETTLAPFRTTITEPYTQTLTKPTDTPAQAASLSVRNEKKRDEAPHDDGPVVVVTDVVVTETTITVYAPPSPDPVTQLVTATVYPVPASPDPVTQLVTATVYPVPAPLPTESHPTVPEAERRWAAVAAAAAAGEANDDTEDTKLRATFGVQHHTPHCASVWTTCMITVTISTSVPDHTPLTSSASASTTSTVPGYAPPASTLSTSASTLGSLSTYPSSITTSTDANASSLLSSAATTTPTPSSSNAGTVDGGGRGGAALAAAMAVLWGLLATVG